MNDKYIRSLSSLHDYAILGYKTYHLANGNTLITEIKDSIVDRDYNTLLDFINGAKMYGFELQDLAKVALVLKEVGMTPEKLMGETVLAETIVGIYKRSIDDTLTKSIDALNKRFGSKGGE